MGKTIRKIGQKGGKHKLPVIEGTAYAEAHDITLKHNCRCEYCMSTRKKQKLPKLIQKDQLDELMDETDLSDFE